MKKVLSLLVFTVLLVVTTSAQGNLQFNRAIYLNMTSTYASSISLPSITQTVTVPTGKVWKIETTYGAYNGNGGTPNINNVQILLDNRALNYFNSAGSSGLAYWSINYPIWLPAGTYTFTTLYLSSSTIGGTLNGTVSGIEFNIIP